MAKKKYDIDLEKMVELGAHYGHLKRRWNPKIAPYIYDVHEGVHLFDLLKTQEALLEALHVIEKAKLNGKDILLIGTKKQAKEKVKEVAEATGVFYVDERWLGGTLTNFEQIRRSSQNMIDTKKKFEAGEYKRRTKKERLIIERKIEKAELSMGGIIEMERLPELMIIVGTHREHAAVAEAKMLGITTVGIVDSNADPADVDFPIPMNDDATGALSYVLDLIGVALSTKAKTVKKANPGTRAKLATGQGKKDGKEKSNS